jgi:hypothetical protein
MVLCHRLILGFGATGCASASVDFDVRPGTGSASGTQLLGFERAMDADHAWKGAENAMCQLKPQRARDLRSTEAGNKDRRQFGTVVPICSGAHYTIRYSPCLVKLSRVGTVSTGLFFEMEVYLGKKPRPIRGGSADSTWRWSRFRTLEQRPSSCVWAGVDTGGRTVLAGLRSSRRAES